MSVSSPVREGLRYSDGKIDIKSEMSPTDSTQAILAIGKEILSSEDQKEDKRRKEELFNMKELMLIHLDYIQQQSEVAAIKDKRIATLEHQVETLKQRLHRMSRRVSLNKGRTNPPSSSAPVSTAPRCSPSATDVPAVMPGQRKRSQSCVGGPRLVQEESALPKKKRVARRDSRLVSKSRRSRAVSESSKTEMSDVAATEIAVTCWSTPQAYLTVVGDVDVSQRWVGSSAAPTIPSATNGLPTDCGSLYQKRNHLDESAGILTPKWRITNLTPIYSMEGTEDVSDSTFEPKHDRLAMDEKRRKKWDVARIREQRQVERLREREEARKKVRATADSNALSIESFFPDPRDSRDDLCLLVSEQLPISFCGIAIPKPDSPTDFTLPWLNRDGTGAVPSVPLGSTVSQRNRRGKR